MRAAVGRSGTQSDAAGDQSVPDATVIGCASTRRPWGSCRKLRLPGRVSNFAARTTSHRSGAPSPEHDGKTLPVSARPREGQPFRGLSSPDNRHDRPGRGSLAIRAGSVTFFFEELSILLRFDFSCCLLSDTKHMETGSFKRASQACACAHVQSKRSI